MSLSDFRIVDSKFASYRITVTPAAGVGARWEVRQEANLYWLARQSSRGKRPLVFWGRFVD